MDLRKITSSQNFKIIVGYVTFLAVLFAVGPLFGRLLRPFVDQFHAAFMAEFKVINKTAEPVYVTPMALWENRERGFIPQYSSNTPPFEYIHQKEHLIGLGDTKQFFYDQDDACLSELVIRNDRGTLKQLAVPGKVSGCDLLHPKTPTIEIERLANLAPVSAEIQKVLARSTTNLERPTFLIKFLSFAVLLLPLLILLIPKRRTAK